LGGGSANAAFTIMLLNTVFKLNLNNEQMKQYAARLGSDCAFFIENKPCIAKGRGEILQPINPDLQGLNLLLVNPGIHISTKEAYSGVTPCKPEYPLEELIAMPLNSWKDYIRNDFEESVFSNHPAIKEIKEEMYRMGAVYASMTGSGSTVYGIFVEKPLISGLFQNNFCKICSFI
jgi:4-diphosphocytidyl-2-C-methyl-D-erythritol kinase